MNLLSEARIPSMGIGFRWQKDFFKHSHVKGMTLLSRVTRWSKQITIGIVMMLMVIFVFSGSAPVLAQANDDYGLNYGELTPLSSTDIRITIMQVINVALGFLGIIALVLMLYAGFLWMTSGGSEEKVSQAKAIMRNALIGLVIIFSAYAIVAFLIRQLSDATGGNNTGGGTPPCEGCGALGSGIIESVYPAPGQQNVPRNTSILATFKVPLDPATVIEGCTSLPCTGPIIPENVIIDLDDDSQVNPLTDVTVATNNGRTFVFSPVDYLGDGLANHWYRVRLTNAIKKDNGQTAFPGASNYYSWRFEIGTLLDFDPVEQRSIFPAPDNTADDYSTNAGTPTTAVLTITNVPMVLRSAAYTASADTVAPAGGVGATVSGTYNATYAGTIEVTLTNDAETQASVYWGPANPNNRTGVAVSGTAVPLGGGLTLTINGDFRSDLGRNQWRVTGLTPATQADTVRIANSTYTFGSDITFPTTGTVTDQQRAVANAIAAQVDGSGSNPQLRANVNENRVIISSQIVGQSGSFAIQTSSLGGTWATVQQVTGSNPQFGALVNGTGDQPRNVVLKFNFNEPINPLAIDQSTITVQYYDGFDTPASLGASSPSSGNPIGIDPAIVNSASWRTVAGSYLMSNLYQSMDFLSDSRCGVCSNSAVACGGDADCNGGTCNELSNACGDPIYCLPVLDDANTASPEYNPTLYRVVAKAGKLKPCSSSDDCRDPSFNQCIDGFCQHVINQGSKSTSGSSNVRYPGTDLNAEGVIDVSKNTFNGNQNEWSLNTEMLGEAEGPQTQSNLPSYNLNSGSVELQGDDVSWYFYVNRNVDLTAPAITAIAPKVGGSGTSLTAPITADFSKVMMGSTMKPGSGYADGMCRCSRVDGNDAQGTCSSGSICEVKAGAPNDYGKCVADGSDQTYCALNEDCQEYSGSNAMCINKKYLSIIDQSTSPVGWWITHQDSDVKIPLDNFADITRAYINHSPLKEITTYGTEIGSGVKDVYQNCYLPSKGPVVEMCDPVTDANCCPVTATEPFCCNGRTLSRVGWETSECYTGY